MLRKNNGEASDFIGDVKFAQNANPCNKTARQRYEDLKKRKCNEEKNFIEDMRNLRKENACKKFSCIPTKKCMMKVGMHDGDDRNIQHHLMGMNINNNGRVTNQEGYTYRETDIKDNERYFEALRKGEVLEQNVATKIAEHALMAYGNPVSFDGSPSGYPLLNCEVKNLPCPEPTPCKKADPLKYDIGISSDGIEIKNNLSELVRAGNYNTVVDTRQERMDQYIDLTGKALDKAREALRQRNEATQELKNLRGLETPGQEMGQEKAGLGAPSGAGGARPGAGAMPAWVQNDADRQAVREARQQMTPEGAKQWSNEQAQMRKQAQQAQEKKRII